MLPLSKLLGVAAAVALSAPVLQALAWRVPFGQLSIAMVVRSMIGAGATALVTGLITAGALALIGDGPADAGLVAAAVGGAMGLALVLLAVLPRRQARGVLLLALRAREKDARPQALPALRRALDAARPRADADSAEHAQLVLRVVSVLSSAGLWEDAEQLLTELPEAGLDAGHRALRAQSLSSCRIQLGDVAGARRALRDAERPAADAATESWLAVTEALLDAVDGRADAALAAVGDEESGEGGALMVASRRIVRAHALAARGDRDRARKELRAVIDAVGAPGLDRAVAPEGPASELARAMRR